MTKKLTLESATAFLADVAPNRSFFVNNGPMLRNVEDFYNALCNMSDEQFSFHRNHEKNDFYNWVLYVVGDSRLANDIARAKTKTTTVKKVKSRLDFLKRMKVEWENGK